MRTSRLFLRSTPALFLRYFPRPLRIQFLDPLFDWQLALFGWSRDVLDQGAWIKAQLPGHADILPINAAASFGLGPLPILFQSRLFQFGHRYAFKKCWVSSFLRRFQNRGGLQNKAVALCE